MRDLRSHNGAEDSDLLRCYIVSSGVNTYRRLTVSGCLHLNGLVIPLGILDPQDVSTILRRNAGPYLPPDTAYYTRISRAKTFRPRLLITLTL